MKRILAYLSYTLSNRKLSLAFFVVVAGYLLYDWQTGWVFSDSHRVKWDNDLNHVVAFATLLVAIAVWFAELTQEWRNHLPKRLTVNFDYQYDGTEEPFTVMRCEKAHLSDVADIRSLGQQIGSQLVDPNEPDRNLSFRAPFVIQKEGGVEYSQKIGGFFYHYNVTFTLNKPPKKLKEDLNTKGKKCKIWIDPFNKVENESIKFV